MSYKNGYDAKPAGSLAPLDSTQDGSKWHHGVGALEISKLTKISAEINTVTEETAVSLAKAQIRVGRLLNEARAMIPGDQQFGMWRAQFTSITNKSTANKLMNLAAQVGEGRITKEMLEVLPLSTLKELISAPDSVLASVQQKVLEGEVVPRSDIRGAGKTEPEAVERTSETVEHSGSGEGAGTPAELEGEPQAKPAIKAPTAPAKPPEPDTRKVIDGILQKPFAERVKGLYPSAPPPYKGCKPLEWAFLVFGLDPDPASMPSEDTIDTLNEVFLDAYAVDDDQHTTVQRAHGIIKEEY